MQKTLIRSLLSFLLAVWSSFSIAGELQYGGERPSESVRLYIEGFRKNNVSLRDFDKASITVYGHVAEVMFSKEKDIGGGFRSVSSSPTYFIDMNTWTLVGCQYMYASCASEKGIALDSVAGDRLKENAVAFLKEQRPGFQPESYKFFLLDVGQIALMYVTRTTTKVERCFCYLVIDKSDHRVLGSGLVYEESNPNPWKLSQ